MSPPHLQQNRCAFRVESRYTWFMSSGEPAQRLLIAVGPRLFADALARALRPNYTTIVADPDTWSPPNAEPVHFDAAITGTAELPSHVSVDRLLRLPEPSSGATLGTLSVGAVERRVAVGGVAAIAAVLGDGLQAAAVGE